MKYVYRIYYRSAVTEKFVSKAFAERNPHITVKERRRVIRKKPNDVLHNVD